MIVYYRTPPCLYGPASKWCDTIIHTCTEVPEQPKGPLFKATCCKCGKVAWHEAPVVGLYFCGYGCT